MLLLLFSLKTQAQEAKTLFGGDNEIKIGGYGAFDIKFTQLDGKFSGLLLGGRGGVIINSMFSIGGAGYGILPTKRVNCPIPEHIYETNNFWTGGYGGLFVEYINSSNSLLHFTANTLIGAGGITYVNHSSNYNSWDWQNEIRRSHPISVVFVVEPGINLELNVSEFFRMNFGASYRYSPNFEWKYKDEDIVPNTAFNGLSINLGFKFGKF